MNRASNRTRTAAASAAVRAAASAARKAATFAVVSAAIVAPAVAACPDATKLGVARTVEIDTTGGPGFGFEHYKAYDFLQPKEVVLTFDDGPQKFSTETILTALADQCTKAIFFSIGKMALGYPEIIRDVARGGHTIGTHTWSHQNLRKAKTDDAAMEEIEKGLSAVKRAAGGPIAPFFRFPTLQDSPATLAHLASRNIAIFSTDIDSFDFKPQPAENIVKSVMAKLEKKGKGIVLLHDIHKTTAKAVPLLLSALQAGGYKIVHIKAKAEATTLAEYDALIEKDAKGLPQVGSERPTSSVVRTIEGEPPPAEAPVRSPAAAPQVKPRADAAPARVLPAEPVSPAVVTAAPVSPLTHLSPITSSIAGEAKGAVVPAAGTAAPHQEPGAPATEPETSETRPLVSEPAKGVWEEWFGR